MRHDYEEDKVSPWMGGKIVGGGNYIHESMLVRGTQNAKNINIDKVLNPQMGDTDEGIHLVVLNSLGRNFNTLVHFVCTRPDVTILIEQKQQEVDQKQPRNSNEETRPTSNLVWKSIPSQATPLEHEIDSANLGLFLISFRVGVPALGKRHLRLHVCDISWTTDQHPPWNVSNEWDCAHEAKVLSRDDLMQYGLNASSSIHVEFDKQTNDIKSMTKITSSGTSTTIELTHDAVLYDGKNDSIYNMNTPVELSDPSPMLGRKPRRIVGAFHGPLFSEVTVEYAPWLIVRYRLLSNINQGNTRQGLKQINSNTSDGNYDDNCDLLDASLFQVSMLSGQIPPSVNVASRFRTNITSGKWFYDENGFHPVEASYNESIGVAIPGLK